MPFSNTTAAAYGLLVMHAMDIYRTHMEVPPAAPPDAWLEARGWTLIGTLHARDTLFPPGVRGPLQILAQDTCYGYLARRKSDGQLAAALRGTDGLVEWLEDGQFIPIPYAPTVKLPFGPPEARVEQGFWDIFSSMSLHDLDGNVVDGTLVDGILSHLTGSSVSIIVVGHSLGSALGTYLAMALALQAPKGSVQACLFASPRTGNKTFVQAFDQTVTEYRLFNYLLDMVPRVPFGPDYEPLPRRTVIQPSTAEANIRMNLACNHHVICYCAMLDYEGTMDVVKSPPAGEKSSALCVLGAEMGAPSLAKTLASALAGFVPV